jgi:nucleoside-diphosphate kinase
MSQTTLSIIKPNAYKNAGKILTMIQEKLQPDVLDIRQFHFTKEIATKFYEEHQARETFGQLVEFMASGPCILIILGGPDIIQRHRTLMKRVRELYADNFMANAIHGSDSVASAKREINLLYDLGS